MVTTFGGYRWNVCDGKSNKTVKPRLKSGVYVILVKSTNYKKRIIAYIGVSINLKSRLYSHCVLMWLRRNRRKCNSIQVLYRSFGEIHSDNRTAEVMLIRFHKPPFNNNCHGSKKGYRLKEAFWRKLRVSNPVWAAWKNQINKD